MTDNNIPVWQSLVLASSSPRRRELLAQIGVQFEVVVEPVDETQLPDEAPTAYVCRLAQAKAAVVAARERAGQNRPVLGADTIVVVDNQVLGKPEDASDAARMLTLLSGRRHQVMSAVCVIQGERRELRLSSTQVSFRPLSRADIQAYWASGEPDGKAGAYAAQGLGALFINELTGSYSGVVGLPLFETAELLAAFSVATRLNTLALLQESLA